MQEYDLAVIGAGPGGYVAAIKAAQLGLRVAIIEERELGGTCLNRGCIPTKTLLHSALLYKEAKDDFETIGLCAKEISYDIKKIYSRKDDVVTQLRGGICQLLKSEKIDVIPGRAQICSANNIKITGETKREISAENILIATGSKPSKPPIPGLDLKNVITSDELLSMNNIAKKIIIIGGGVIGVEFATVFNALGCDVTVIEAMERILPTMDREISQNLTMILKKRGVKIHAASMVSGLTQGNAQNKEGLTCHFTEKAKELTAEADIVLVAIGRKANTDGLLAGDFALEMNRGMIIVNEKFQTSVPNIYAIGDVIPGIQLAHMAEAEGKCAAEIIAGKEPLISLDIVPGCIYTNPEIASVGLTADEAKTKNIITKTGKSIMSANGKSLIEMQDRGFIKLVFDAESDKIIGAQLMCARATDLISELTTAIVNGLTRAELLKVIRPHPTFTEAVTSAAESVR